MAEFTSVVPHRRWWRKGAVAPMATPIDYRLMANTVVHKLMGQRRVSALAAFPALDLTRGTDRWPLRTGYLGSFAGDDMILTLHDAQVAGHHAKVTCHKDKYFVEPVAQHSTYLQIASRGTHREGYPLQNGDVFELSELFIITVLEIEVNSSTSPASAPPARSSKVQFGHVTLDTKPPQHISLSPPPKLQKSTRIETPKLLVLQLQRKPEAFRVAAHSLRSIEPVQVVTFSNHASVLIGSLPGCDLYAPELCPIHAKIEFANGDYVLSDVAYGTRVFLRNPVQIVIGDQLVLGETTLTVDEAPSPPVPTAGLAISHLRNSVRRKRKAHAPLHVALPRDKTLNIGRATECDIALGCYALKLLQFSVHHTQQRVSVRPLFGALNQGVYFLLHRRAPRHVHFFADKQAISPPVVARGLQLARDTVLRIGNSELEVVAIKEKSDRTLSQGMQNRYWNERVAVLQKLPWLLLHSIPNGLTEITYLAYHAKEVEFRAGESIYKQGHDALNTYVILEGHIILHRNGQRDGKYLEQLGPGDWCGEVALLRPPARLIAAYDTHAIAQTNVACVVLSARDLYYMCGNYRELYQVPLTRGIVEREVLQSLKDLHGLERVCPTLLHRVGFRLKLSSFPAGTDLSAQGLGLYCLVRGSVLCKYEADETTVRTACTWFGELTSLSSPPLSVHAQDAVSCYTLSLEEYKRSIELSLVPPTRNDPRLQVGARDRGLSRADLSHETAKKEASGT
ncbi:hypothetical protein, variant [Saprolegnia diclina VS20]|uniref:Cyclic nucleotide-binding domain-containing protein n=1 Tax=Saprolegnia diclina (strain VS20) TaxID=1156394 RepID=T0R5B3_SAPDV|nr:hypothetical protein, variant [Saprolegnia diclina VS20]EQC27268.1 hypothetical protein, variant [Saprolegnia diclina VS20]|eukprot:XP_008619271.1 hypothetical protein, variant [Saprolegnia diclina VS20]